MSIIPPTQPVSFEDDSEPEQDPSCPSSIERDSDEEDVAQVLVDTGNANYVASVAGKRPAVYRLPVEDIDWHEAPDLAEIFSEAGLPPLEQIALCRTYANYLAAAQRAQKKARTSQ